MAGADGRYLRGVSANAIPFPTARPSGYEWFDDEPQFDPAVHLDLVPPDNKTYLADLGYSSDEIATKSTPIAASGAYKVLSSQGAAVLLDSARRLRLHATACERIDTMVRGGVYRSRFLKDLCLDPSLTEMMCEIFESDVAPHTMPVHLGHLNFEPDVVDKAVDKWHHDTLPCDFVLMVTDPRLIDGGEFEYFLGTKDEMAALASEDLGPPRDRVVSPEVPGQGWAIALHGDMVVHRAAPLHAPGERITMVNGYVATDTTLDEQARSIDLIGIDDHETLFTEWARHAAWRASGRLDNLIDSLEFTSDRDAVVAQLNEAIADVKSAVEDMYPPDGHSMAHYE